MRTLKYLIITLLCVAALGMISCNKGIKTNPLLDCTASNVEEIIVEYGVNHYSLKQEELTKFLILLSDIELIESDNTMKKIDGDDFWCLIIKLKTGDTVSLDLASPYIVINDVGYRVESESCIELQIYVQNIVENTFK